MRRCSEICKYCEFLEKYKYKQTFYVCRKNYSGQFLNKSLDDSFGSADEFTAWKKFFERDVPEGCMYYVEHCMKECNK